MESVDLSPNRVFAFGERLIALADRAIWWPERKTLLVADVHFGKAATFRAHSIPVPGGTTSTDLERLSQLVAETEVESLVILGDMWHSAASFAQETVRVIHEWREEHADLEVVLVRGNHDRRAGDLPHELRIRQVEEPWEIDGLSLAHDPGFEAEALLCGHIHPCVALSGRGRESMRVPCFWVAPHRIVLPAFGSFTGCARIEPAHGDEVLLCAEGKLFPAAAVR